MNTEKTELVLDPSVLIQLANNMKVDGANLALQQCFRIQTNEFSVSMRSFRKRGKAPHSKGFSKSRESSI